MAWRPDGRRVALGGYKEVRLIDPATRKPLATLAGQAEAVRSIAFSRDGKRLAAAGGLPARKGEVKIWDVARRRKSRPSPATPTHLRRRLLARRSTACDRQLRQV